MQEYHRNLEYVYIFTGGGGMIQPQHFYLLEYRLYKP